jgi:hypothetical protein
MLDGEVIDPSEESVRSMVVSEINTIARSAARHRIPTGGWHVAATGGLVMEIPVDSGVPNVFSTVTVLVKSTDLADLGQAADQVAKTAELAGYSSDERALEPLRNFREPPPKGTLARIWAWIRAMFGRKPAS